MAGKPRAAEDRLRATFVRRAIESGADLLAAPLHKHAEADEITWHELAASLNCTEDGLNRVACCRPPRDGSYDDDLRSIASIVTGDRKPLLSLLGSLFPARGSALRVAETTTGYHFDEPETP